MLEFLRTRLQQGTRTSSFPEEPDGSLPERFRGRPTFDPGRCENGCRDCAARLPSELLTQRPDGDLGLDIGACLFSPEEASTCPHQAIEFTPDYRRKLILFYRS